MANKVDVSEIENFSKDLKAASADVKSSLNKVEEQIEQINSMKSFSGKAAKSAKQYFGDVHLTILESFKGLFEDLEENLHQHMKTFESKVDASDSAVIRSNYLQDVKEDINETFEDLKKQDEIIHETIEDISDISSATPPSFSDVNEWKKEAIKEIKELDEDLDAFTGEGNETDVKELMQQIEAVMNNAKTSEGQARFADFKGATQDSNLAKLKEYNQTKMEDVEKQIEQLDPQSQAYLKQAQADYDKEEIDKATYEAIRLGIIESGTSFVKSASNENLPDPVSEQVEEDIGQWADNLNENQEVYQNMVGQRNLNSEYEDEQLAAFMAEGYLASDEYDVNKYEFPEDEPLGFWDKHAVMAKDSSLAGTPDGLAGPAAFTFDALKKPASISSSAAKEEAILDRLPDEIAGPAATTFDVAKGVDNGIEDAIDDFLVGTATMAGHPIETGKSLVSAAANPPKTANIMADAISTSYNRDVTNGDAESRARWFSYATTTIGTSFIGASGPNAASKVSRVGSSAARTTKKTATDSINRFKINNPFEPQPALNAGSIDVPYNVYNGETIKNQNLQLANKFDGGQKKGGPNAENKYLFSKGLDKAKPEKVSNSVTNFQSKKMMFGNKQFLLDKKGVKHILKRHHPEFWNGTVKKRQTFLDKKLSVDDVEEIVQSVMKQNRNTLKIQGTTGSYQISGTVNGVEYIVGVNKGRVGQLYPK